MRADNLIDSISVSDYYLEVTKQEAAYLMEQGIKFEGNVLEENNVIKILKSKKEKVEGMLEIFRRKNNYKK